MSFKNDSDEYFHDLDLFNGSFMKKLEKMMEDIHKATRNGKLDGRWHVDHINEPGLRGYIIRGQFETNQPLGSLEPLDPLEPYNPMKRRPVPKRPFETTEKGLKEIREPLIDVFDEEKAVSIYVELPGEDKDDIQLNVTADNAEIKTSSFYKMIRLPKRDILPEKATSKYMNGILKIIIPKRRKTRKKSPKRINID